MPRYDIDGGKEMKTLIAVVFGMVLESFLNWLLYRSVKSKMLQYRDKDGTIQMDVDEFEITLTDDYDATMEGNKIIIRKKKEDKE